jgi:hypothetical protein
MIENLKNSLGKDYKTFIDKMNVSADVKKLLKDSFDYFINNLLLGKQFWIKEKNWFKTFIGWYWKYIKRTEVWFLIATLENVIAAISDADAAVAASVFGTTKELGSGALKSVMAFVPLAGPMYAGGSLINATINMIGSGVSYLKRQYNKRENPQAQESITDIVMNLDEAGAKNFVENNDGLKNVLPQSIENYQTIEYKKVTGQDGKTKIQVWLDGINTVTLEKKKTALHPIDGEVKITQ